MRRGKEEKAEQDYARIYREGDSKYEFWSSPFPPIATKKEGTSVAGEGRISLIAVRKSVQACCKDVAQAQILIERTNGSGLSLSLSLSRNLPVMWRANSRHAAPHSKYHRVAKHSRNCQTTERTKELDKRKEKGTSWQFSLTVQLRERLQRAGIAVHVSWNREKVGVPIKTVLRSNLNFQSVNRYTFRHGNLDKRIQFR